MYNTLYSTSIFNNMSTSRHIKNQKIYVINCIKTDMCKVTFPVKSESNNEHLL